LMILGIIGIAYGFMTTPKTVEQVEQLMKDEHHGHDNHDAHVDTAHADHTSHADASFHEDANDDVHAKHLEHVLHQLQNKPWAAVYVGCIFFMLIAVGVFTFNQIQYAASAGWSPVLFRVMEALSAYMLPGAILFLLLLIASSSHLNHLFIWMDADVVANDPIIAAKTGYLNVPFFLIRALIFLSG